jgi:UDP-GlcNAc3NAcA epimerase
VKINLENRTHSKLTGELMSKLEDIMKEEKPEYIMVYGDTNSTLAAALVASKALIPLIHIEAGLRSFNKQMPEEINRVITDHVSSLLFCPTQIAYDNLLKENIKDGVHLVGDVMFDIALYYKNKICENLEENEAHPFALCTIHRQENADNKDNLRDIFLALNEIASNVEILLPLHPRTKKMIDLYGINTGKVKLIEPVGYFDMLKLLTKCSMVITDSGGLQKEAYFFKKPLLILRSETEWQEVVTNNSAFLVGTKSESIIAGFVKINTLSFSGINPYGDGHASEKIVDIIANTLSI